MAASVVSKDAQYVLNLCTKYLARDNSDERSNFGQYQPGDPRGAIAEAWRFPVVDTYWDGVSADSSYPFDAVTFVFDGHRHPASSVSVVGSFTELFDPLPLAPVPFAGQPSGIWSVTVRVPKGQVHRYRFVVDGVDMLDPVNPQTMRLDNGVLWSRFFTSACAMSLVLSRRERDVLAALVRHIMPFRTAENSLFISQVYNQLDRAGRGAQFPLAYLLDEDVGAVNFIDKVLAREEMHHAVDYHICLPMVDRLMRDRLGGLDPLEGPVENWADLYDQLALGQVPGWDYGRYHDPAYFLTLLRRHAITGAFTHPRHAGNSGAAGWCYLQSRYVDSAGQTLFDWESAIEAPLGRNIDYRG
jgi:Gluconate 2-dehydrogenase subunit 3